MKLFIDSDTLQIITGLSNRQPATGLAAKAGGVLPVQIQFVSDGEAATTPTDRDLIWQLRELGKYEGPILASVTDFAPVILTPAEGETPATYYPGLYAGTASMTEEALAALFLRDNNAANDVATIAAQVEVAWRDVVGASLSRTNNTPQVDVSNWQITDQDAPPASAPSRVLVLLSDVTTLTGGTATALDGLPTANNVRPLNQIVGVVIDNAESHYQLQTGTAATSLPAIVRPADFNAITNPRIWRQIPSVGKINIVAVQDEPARILLTAADVPGICVVQELFSWKAFLVVDKTKMGGYAAFQPLGDMPPMLIATGVQDISGWSAEDINGAPITLLQADGNVYLPVPYSLSTLTVTGSVDEGATFTLPRMDSIFKVSLEADFASASIAGGGLSELTVSAATEIDLDAIEWADEQAHSLTIIGPSSIPVLEDKDWTRLWFIDGTIIEVPEFPAASYISFAGNPITTVSATVFAKHIWELDFRGCALNVASVDTIINAVAEDVSVSGLTPGALKLEDGTNATPSAASADALAALATAGWTVTYNAGE